MRVYVPSLSAPNLPTSPWRFGAGGAFALWAGSVKSRPGAARHLSRDQFEVLANRCQLTARLLLERVEALEDPAI